MMILKNCHLDFNAFIRLIIIQIVREIDLKMNFPKFVSNSSLVIIDIVIKAFTS